MPSTKPTLALRTTPELRAQLDAIAAVDYRSSAAVAVALIEAGLKATPPCKHCGGLIRHGYDCKSRAARR
jgi:hypothetical protein